MRLRFLLDTNVLIPLHDTYQVLEPNLANFVRLAGVGGHQLLYHPATEADFGRDANIERQQRNLQRLKQYTRLENPAACPWNSEGTNSNDGCDAEILYALECDAVHALVTEDRGLHAKARGRGLRDRVYTIQMAEDWLRRLHEPKLVTLPNIDDVPLHRLTPLLPHAFFDSLRIGYPEFDDWFRKKSREDRRAWVYNDETDTLSAICIYAIQSGEFINDQKEILPGNSLKLCTFKVGEKVRGRKIGELFLKAAFRFATETACENIFIHMSLENQDYLIRLLEDFGFVQHGNYGADRVLVKNHPRFAPDLTNILPLDYARLFFPHYRTDPEIKKFLVPIQPHFHDALFPDYLPKQKKLFGASHNAGNAIKLAYICHAPTNSIEPGDILLFYRTHDEKAVTTLGVVDRFKVLSDAAEIASLVSRRTVYSLNEIEALATKQTKVILFRVVEHFVNPVTYIQLINDCKLVGPSRSIRRVMDDQFSKVINAAKR